MSDHWSREEVEATVSDYFEMLAKELRGEPFNKAEHNRNLQKLLNGRSKASIEKKHQNVSAVLIDLGYPYIDGYKPLVNYQHLLHDIVEERLSATASLEQAAAAAVEQTVENIPAVTDILSILVTPPRREDNRLKFYDRAPRVRRPVRRNYLEMESRNRTLGIAGEKFVLEYEHKRLWQAGKKNLANRIDHIAETQGDGVGYDIKSFETDGRERLIEVKTTRFGAQTPFFPTKGEVEFSESREIEYQLYRLFSFTQKPRLFVLPGSLRKTCSLDPTQFSARPL